MPPKQPSNLNNLRISTDQEADVPLGDPATRNGDARCYFRHIEERFLEEMADPSIDAVVGCVAWLTSKRILEALRKKKLVSFVVQKEDFLRPDSLSRGDLRAAYANLVNTTSRDSVGGLIGDLSRCCVPQLDAIRCLGNHNSAKHPAHPRMHHKFAVFCKLWVHTEDPDVTLTPQKVWTGSFNFTANGTQSLENAVVLDDATIANAYYREWEQLFALSEPLDWSTPWVSPEYRIGS
jgi:hypothetical protein